MSVLRGILRGVVTELFDGKQKQRRDTSSHLPPVEPWPQRKARIDKIAQRLAERRARG